MLIESLETRRLLSASAAVLQADISAIKSDVQTARNDAVRFQAELASDYRTLSADLRRTSSSNRGLLVRLRTDVLADERAIKRDLGVAVRIGKQDVGKIVAAERALAKNPSNAGASARLAEAKASLSADSSGLRLGPDAVALNTVGQADLAAITAANPTNAALQSAAQTASQHLSSADITLSADAAALQAAVTKLIGDA